ncbi:PQQ-binding-like beta-propeller repeat protein [Alloacidobacterium sp.]|uniref:outer membrane protein assembly factor BamB family protein n=1 Tax=Alloacidobacterium sp. TaxID=2951999 RepID=UPI002D618FFB|nr:PQQ-binding-like beta-propeller repeat protein [Alloacidobacterium sp.]HYK37119.1 PQQ-binding-like beta-propeller repeat protein [Alloacidobacterium sp.]
MLTIAPLCLVLTAAAGMMSAYAQTSNDAASATTSTSSPADWTEFHRDNMQRWNPYETVLGVNNVGNLKLKWKNPIGADTGGSGFSSSPAVVNGVIYFGSTDGTVYALSASTGAKLWGAIIGTPVRSSPAVANGVVYIASAGAMLVSPYVYALNANTGAVLWFYSTAQNVVSSPVVVNGVVYIASGEFDISSGTVYALNASTGALLWSFSRPKAVESSPAVANGVVYFSDEDGQVYALNANAGTLLWSYYTGGRVESSPAVANGVVYVGSENGDVFALNASTGAKLWSYATGNVVDSSPAVANGVVYIGSADGNVYALNASTGAKLWSYAAGGNVDSSPAVANGVVYVGSSDNNIYALDAGTGANLWNFDTGGAVDSSPAVVNGVVYVRAGDTTGNHQSISAFSVGADLFLRVSAAPTPYQNGQLLTYTFPVWNLGPDDADHEVLNTQIPYPFVFDYIRISGTPGLGTCTHPPHGGSGAIVCHENSSMAPNTTWTVRLTVMLPPGIRIIRGSTIIESGTVTADTPDPNPANNTATVSLTVQ